VSALPPRVMIRASGRRGHSRQERGTYSPLIISQLFQCKPKHTLLRRNACGTPRLLNKPGRPGLQLRFPFVRWLGQFRVDCRQIGSNPSCQVGGHLSQLAKNRPQAPQIAVRVCACMRSFFFRFSPISCTLRACATITSCPNSLNNRLTQGECMPVSSAIRLRGILPNTSLIAFASRAHSLLSPHPACFIQHAIPT
jgi:hypothetical protein